MVEQHANGVELGVAHGEQQRRETGLRLRGNVRAGGDQRTHRFDVALAGREHQRGLAAVALGGVDRGAVASNASTAPTRPFSAALISGV